MCENSRDDHCQIAKIRKLGLALGYFVVMPTEVNKALYSDLGKETAVFSLVDGQILSKSIQEKSILMTLSPKFSQNCVLSKNHRTREAI